MERDKTQLHFVHSQELNRQKTIVKDRIRRMKEKTMTGMNVLHFTLHRTATECAGLIQCYRTATVASFVLWYFECTMVGRAWASTFL